jgi:hypothetical protein
VDDTETTRRWVATPDSARRAAAEFLKLLVRRPWWWGLLGMVEVLYAMLLALSFPSDMGPVSRVVWGALLALVPTLCLGLVLLGISYAMNRRRFRERLYADVVLEAGVAERSLVLRSPWAEHVISFDGLAQVVRSGDWVFLKQKGVPLWGIWPAALFLPEDLARVQRSIAARSVGST